MFISVKKGVFDPSVEKQINNSFSLIDKKIDSEDIPEVDETIKVASLDVENAETNYSIMIGNQIVVFCKVASGVTSLSIDKSVAPLTMIRTRAITETNSDEYYTAYLSTTGTLSVDDHDEEVIVYITYNIANNPLISK